MSAYAHTQLSLQKYGRSTAEVLQKYGKSTVQECGRSTALARSEFTPNCPRTYPALAPIMAVIITVVIPIIIIATLSAIITTV